MKSLLLLAILTVSSQCLADQYVNGYYRANGTYVQPHYRSSPDSSQFNNYSHQGNTNPYTGQQGTHDYQPTYPKTQTFKPYGNFR